jgi:hypothetical protein
MNNIFLGGSVAFIAMAFLATNVSATDRKALINELTHDIAVAAGQAEPANTVESTPVAEPTGVAGANSEAAASPSAAKRLLRRSRKPIKETVGTKTIDSSSGYITVGVALLLLVGVGFWLKKKAVRIQTDNSHASIETIATARLAGKHLISLVRVPGRVLVVGMGENGLTLLTELDDSEMDGGTGTGGKGPGPGGFINRLVEQGFSGSKSGGLGAASEEEHPFLTAIDDGEVAVDELLRERTRIPERNDERNAIRDRLRRLRQRTQGGLDSTI